MNVELHENSLIMTTCHLGVKPLLSSKKQQNVAQILHPG